MKELIFCLSAALTIAVLTILCDISIIQALLFYMIGSIVTVISINYYMGGKNND